MDDNSTISSDVHVPESNTTELQDFQGSGDENMILETQDDHMIGTLPIDMLNGDDTEDIPPLLECQSTQTPTAPYPSPLPSMTTLVTIPQPYRDIKDPNAVHGVCGLKNLGNTCFMNSGLQCLISNPHLIHFFTDLFQSCGPPEDNQPINLTETFCKMLHKAWCGQYSTLHLTQFKDTLGSQYPQFRDFRQHDCQEFLALMLDNLHEHLNHASHSIQKSTVKSTNPVLVTSLALKATDQQYRDNNAGSDIMDDCRSDVTASSIVRSEIDESDQSVTHSDATSPTECIQLVTLHSEDSNHSGISSHSTDSRPLNRSVESQSPFLPINNDLNMKNNETLDFSSVFETKKNEVVMCNKIENSHTTEKNLLSDNNTNARIRLPSFEDYYMKDTKTKNTNVLMEFDEEDCVVTDSEKFSKPDNNSLEQSENVNDLASYTGDQIEKHCHKSFKCNNLLNDMKRDLDSKNDLKNIQPDCSINNIKRIKIDEEEKNLRIQARHRNNVTRNPTKGMDTLSADTDQADIKGNPVNIIDSEQDKMDGACSLSQPEPITIEEELIAEKTWHQYIHKNNSIIVDTFQGQFRSTVTCFECQHVSMTYEPFMYLSVPLPHAMERQICVIYVPSDNKQPVRYLVTLNRTDNVRKLKDELWKLSGGLGETHDLFVAEVLHHHIARVLDDHILVRYVNDYNRVVYAFEMMPCPQTDDSPTDSATIDDVTPQCEQESDVFSQVGFFNYEPQMELTDAVTMAASQTYSADDYDNVSDCFGSAGSSNDATSTEPIGVQDNMLGTTSWQQNKKEAVSSWLTTSMGQTTITETQSTYSDIDDFTWAKAATNEQQPVIVPTAKSYIQDNAVLDESANTSISLGQSGGWKACAICLEEMDDSVLLVHTNCGGTLCQACLEMTCKHYGSGSEVCPVCTTAIDMAVDFIPMTRMASFKPKAKVVCIPVLYRHDNVDGANDHSNMKMIYHPNILRLPNVMSGELLYETVDRVVPFIAEYTIRLTDGQGYNCSRCLFTQHCKGCILSRDSDIILQPSDHLAVCFDYLPNDQLAGADSYLNHKTMEQLRSNDPLTLYDCFGAFTQSEILDEQNPWFCPNCTRNQRARKTITIWRYPDTLIVYLKRFVFHELSGTKLDNKVVFPLENLDLSEFLSGPENDDLVFDLQACVCHYGGVNSGHYTSYSKHPVSKKWHNYNDETVTVKDPGDDVYSDAYILFYRRQGSEIDFHYPENPCSEGEAENISIVGPVHTISQDAVTKALESLDHTCEASTSTTMDFGDIKLDFCS